jgi:hypothetical protein
VLPYPWPKGQFTPTGCARMRQVAAAWPAERAVQRVADRGFPSRRLLLTLRQVRWGWTVRLRATDGLTLDGQAQPVRALLAAAAPEVWTARAGQFGQGPAALPGTLVVGRGLAVLPWHQRGPGSLRHRAAQHRERQHYLVRKHARRRRPTTARQTDPWVVLFTSHPHLAAGRAELWAAVGPPRAATGTLRAAGMAGTAGTWSRRWPG